MIVYAAISPGETCGELYTQTLDKKYRHRLTRTSACESAPDWAPDGSRIVFSRRQQVDGVFGTAIVVADAFTGAGARRIGFVSGSSPVMPRWLTDSASIVFGGLNGIEIVRVADGTKTTILPDLRGIAGVAPSPDSNLLVYSHAELTELNGKIGNRLSVSPSDGSARRPLTIGDSDESPDWRRMCTIYGTERNDRLTGTAGNDIICALQGDDVVDAGEGNDLVVGGDGNDNIVGGPGSDKLFGSGGNDRIGARDAEQDVVMGGPGTNSVEIDAIDVNVVP